MLSNAMMVLFRSPADALLSPERGLYASSTPDVRVFDQCLVRSVGRVRCGVVADGGRRESWERWQDQVGRRAKLMLQGESTIVAVLSDS